MDKPNPPPTTKMHAYVIMLHLRSQGWTNFTEIRKLFCWENMKMGLAIGSVAHIDQVIDYLSEKWGEDIPKFNAFIFSRETQCTDYICENVLPKREKEQPHPQEVAAHAAAVIAYPNWDKIVEYLRREAFEAAE